MNYFKHDTALVATGARIGEGTRVWAFVNIQDGVVIGRNGNICDCCFVEKNVVIGDNVTVKNGVSVFEGVTLEDDVFVGPNATFINDRHPRSRRADWKMEKTLVRKGAAIGANATVMCGITIGAFAVIGAGAVVLKDVPAHAMVVGNPARQVGWVSHDGERLNGKLESPSGAAYRKTGNGLERI
ncbi:MAG: N-acetyltransferase [Candidatus Omnitrophica bacterium]|nr:N-acetyltransferase [Candidatus Omnitrophota bacterium]